MKKKVVLIGFPGAGKSSVGFELERIYGWSWLDLDREIELRSGRTVANIIREEGETQFRDLESHALKDALSADCDVISVGGGALLAEENRNLLLGKSTLVHLEVSVEEAVKRLSADEAISSTKGATKRTEPVRPLLVGKSGTSIEENIEMLADRRKGIYDIAQIKVSSDGLDGESLARKVFSEIEKYRKCRTKLS